ncbi:MAG: biotin/lipoyl-containing protein [Muribaculaceae bacterium]|nr:biotin/lipoyl-containing protein [Muribaculaceae bacterium]
MEKKLKIRDLTLRDGQQSLFATRLKQQDIDPLLPLYKDAGFYIMEVWGGAVPDSVMRYLDESPWDRLRKISKAIDGKSLLSALSRGRNLFGYVPYPDSVLEGFYKEAIKNGLNVMRIFDALNDIDNVKESIRLINELGGIADAAVCYTVDPKDEAPAEPEKKGFFAKLFGKKEAPVAPKKIFTDEYFVNLAVEMERLGAKIITLKDMAGLVNPMRAASVIGKLKAAVKVPVDFHTHCTPGYGLASSLMAILNGVDILDTNIWWFGEGSAAPAIELVYIFCKKLGIEVDVNMEKVGEIRDRLEAIRHNLADFDLNKDHFPKKFNPLTDTLPAEVDALFDKAIAAAKAGNEEELLDACHAIEDYFGFPKPNLLVKDAEVPGGMYSNMVAQLKALGASDLLDDAMRLIPKVRRDAGLVPLVTPTSQIVGSQAVLLAMDRRKGNPDYTQTNNQFISLVKGEYGHTPVPVNPAFREKITGDAAEKPYDVSTYKKPANPEVAELGNAPLASNQEEYLLLELLPNVANKFLRNRREEEFKAKQPAEEPKAAAAEAKAAVADEPVTGELFTAPMGGRIVEINVKPGDTVKKGSVMMVYEAMKMENDLEAPRDLKVKRVFVAPDEVVGTDARLIEFE